MPSALVEPNATRQLSDGVVVDASIVGRVFGIRLLRLNANIVIAPAEIVGPPRALAGMPVSPPAPTRPRPPAAPSGTRGARHGDALADAMRLIQESGASLDAARAVRRQR
jgi:hypothetical protein